MQTALKSYCYFTEPLKHDQITCAQPEPKFSLTQQIVPLATMGLPSNFFHVLFPFYIDFTWPQAFMGNTPTMYTYTLNKPTAPI